MLTRFPLVASCGSRVQGFGGGDTGNGGQPQETGGEIPAQQPLSATRVADEQFISKLPEELQDTLRRVWSEHGGFEEQRRGVQPLARTQALADRTQLPESVAPGTAFNAEQVTAAYDQLIGKEREYQQLKPKVENGTATDAEWLRHRELDVERVLAGERVRGAVAETGRSMRAIRAKVEELKAIQVAQQSNDPVMVQQTREALSRGRFANAFNSYLYGNLVSGVATMERNFMGNALMLVNDIAGDVVTGKPRAAGAMVVGALNGLPRGLKEFAYVMRHGGSAEAGAGKVPISRELPGGMLNPWNDVLRTLSATDRLFRAISNRAEVTRRAWMEAGNGANRIDRASRLMAEHPEWYADAEKISTNRLFQDKGGKVASAAIALRDSVPVVGVIVAPFIRISANLTRMAVTMSPAPYILHFANKVAGANFQLGRDLVAPGRVGELARARAAYGTAVLAALAPYAFSGNVTGDGPRDPGKRAIWLQTHQPNSIKLGGRWVSLQTWPGVGLTLQALANGVETLRDMRASGQEPDAASITANVFARTVNSILSQSFLQGVEDFQNAISDPIRYAERAGARVASSFQPLVGMQRSIAQTIDSTVRAPQGIAETLKANTPGVSKTVPPLLDPFGEPVQRQQSPLTVGFAKVQRPSDDSLVLALQSLGMGQARPHGRVDLDGDGTPEPLSRQEQLELDQALGREWRSSQTAVINDPRFRELDPDLQRKLLRSAKAEASRRINAAAKAELLTRKQALVDALSGGR
jgi:hypothetical protein